MARLFFGNTVNRVMLNSPTVEHSTGLAAVAARKLWLATAGDAIVTAHPIDPAFRAYVQTITCTPSSSIRFFSPDCSCDTVVPEISGFWEEIRPHVWESQPQLCFYALDEPALAFAGTSGLPIAHYRNNPSLQQVRQFSEWNRKSGFRRLASELGLPIVPGRSCRDLPEILEAVEELRQAYWPLLLKLDRSSNGYGSLMISGLVTMPAALEAHLRKFSRQGDACVLEAFLQLQSAPSVEALVDDDGVHPTYLCDQLCTGQSFRGIFTPAPGLSSRTVNELLKAAETFGQHLRTHGYRGHFDLDAAVTREGALVFTEANIRRTAGTALHEMVARIAGEDYSRDRMWLADTQPAAADCRFAFADVADAISSAGLTYSHRERRGVVLPAFTLPHDSKWRYLIIGGEADELRHYERRLATVLKLDLTNLGHTSNPSGSLPAWSPDGSREGKYVCH